MKKILVAVAIAAFATGATAALLTGEQKTGTKKVCIYKDGSTQTVCGGCVCPRTN